MKTQYDIHPDFRRLSAIHPPLSRKIIPGIQKLMGLLYHQQRSDRQVRVDRVRIPAGPGLTVRALLYTPRSGPVHGYDMMLKSPMVKDLIERRIRFLSKAFLSAGGAQ